MSTTPKDLFKQHVVPPSRLHDAVQKLARQEGWSPPWDREQQESQRKAAGKKSGLVRRRRGELRSAIIQAAYASLTPTHKYEPFSSSSIDALQKEYFGFLGKGGDAPRSRISPTDVELDDYETVVSVTSVLTKGDLQGNRGAPRSHIIPTDEELDVEISMLFAIADLSETDRKALQKVSRDTLRKGLMQLGITSRRVAQRAG